MIIEAVAFGERVRADLSRGIDACWPVRFDDEGAPAVRAFSLPNARRRPVAMGEVVGAVARGGSVNCDWLELWPHGNGTHTECLGHLLPEGGSVALVAPKELLPCLVVSARPVLFGEAKESYGGRHKDDDVVITRAWLEAAIDVPLDGAALVVRAGLSAGDTSGTNPPYFTTDAARFCAEKNVAHLLTDLPSLDREDDGGALASHRAFWRGGPERTVTELCRLLDVDDGRYLLSLHVSPLASDAAPSRPWLFPIEVA